MAPPQKTNPSGLAAHGSASSGKGGDPELGWGTRDPLSSLAHTGSGARHGDLSAVSTEGWELSVCWQPRRVGRVPPWGSPPTHSLPACRPRAPTHSLRGVGTIRHCQDIKAQGPFEVAPLVGVLLQVGPTLCPPPRG